MRRPRRDLALALRACAPKGLRVISDALALRVPDRLGCAAPISRPRERIDRLIDQGSTFFELGLWAAWEMYGEWGGAPSAGYGA